MFSSEFYEISKNTFFTEHLRTTASIHSFFRDQCCWSCLNTLKCFWKYNERKTKHPFLIKNGSTIWQKIATWLKKCIDDPREESITANSEEDCITEDSKRTLSLRTLKRILSMKNLKRGLPLSLWHLQTMKVQRSFRTLNNFCATNWPFLTFC